MLYIACRLREVWREHVFVPSHAALVRLVMAASVSVICSYSQSAEALLLQHISNIPITPQQSLSTAVAIGLFTFADPSSSHAAQVARMESRQWCGPS